MATPNVGPNFNTLFSVTSLNGHAWAVGVHLDDQYRDRALVEHWDGTEWTVVDVPQPGSERDLLYSVSARTPSDIWAVGDQQGADGKFRTLAEHWDGQQWSVVPTLTRVRAATTSLESRWAERTMHGRLASSSARLDMTKR